MLEIPHVIVAAAIASKVPDPMIALPLALASHFALDMLPHWNPHLNVEIKEHGKVSQKTKNLLLFDSFGALIMGSLLALRFYPDVTKISIVLLACFLGVFPDVIKIPHYFLKSKSGNLKKYIVWDKGIQNDVSAFWGFVSQAVVTIMGLWWIFG